MRTPPLTAAAVGLLLLATPAVAQAPALSLTLKPDTTSRATRLTITASGADTSALAGRIPSSIMVDLQKGAKLDPASVAATCTLDQAKAQACPADSIVGGGSAVLTVTSPFGTMDLTASLSVALGAPVDPGDVASVLLSYHEPTTNTSGAAQGQVLKTTGTYGLRLSFTGLGDAGSALPPGVTASLKSLTLGISHNLKLKGTKHSLLTTPPTCSGGTFKGLATLSFSSGDPVVQPLTTPCVQAKKPKKPTKHKHHRTARQR